jgi:TRAP transporter TAXI family solute receptor
MRPMLHAVYGGVATLAIAVALPGAGWGQSKTHPPVQFITGSATATWFATGAMVAELTNVQYEGQPISVIPGAGGVGNPLNVGSGQSDIGISYAPFLKLAMQGNNEMYEAEGFSDLCAIFAGTSNKLHIILDPTGEVRDIDEIKEKQPALRIATGPRGSTELFSLEEVLKEAGVTRDEIVSWGGRLDLVGSSERADAWNNRQVDMANFFINNPASAVIELMSGREAKLVSLDDDVRNALSEKWGFQKLTIPANDYPGQTEPVETIGLPFVVFASTNLDDELVYDMVKAVAENKDRMAQSHSAFSDWEPADMSQGLGIPVCPGAERYYGERGWASN